MGRFSRSAIIFGVFFLVIGGECVSAHANGLLSEFACPGLLRNPKIGPSPFVELFSRPGAVEEIFRLCETPSTPAAENAQLFWAWFAREAPELASQQERAYLEDVFELSWPVYSGLAGNAQFREPSYREGIVRQFGDVSQQIATLKPANVFKRSGKKFFVTAEKKPTFGEAFFVDHEKVSSGLSQLNRDLLNPGTWKVLTDSIREIQAQVAKDKAARGSWLGKLFGSGDSTKGTSVTSSLVTRLLGGALVEANSTLMGFRSRMAAYSTELAPLMEMRERLLREGAQKILALDAKSAADAVHSHEAEAARLDLSAAVSRLDDSKTGLQMTTVFHSMIYDYLDKLEGAFSSARQLSRPNFEAEKITDDSEIYQKIMDILNTIDKRPQISR